MIAKQVKREIMRICREAEKAAAPYYPNGDYELPLVLRSAYHLTDEFEMGIIELKEARLWHDTLIEDAYDDASLEALNLIDEMLEEEVERIRWARARAALRRKEESEKASRFSLGSALKAAMGG